MVILSKNFLSIVRQYGILEDANNKDYTELITAMAERELQKQLAAGVPWTPAVTTVNQALAAFVKRFPVQLSDIPF